MIKNKTIHLLILTTLFATALLTACSTKPTAVPLSEIDLKTVMLHQEDLPNGFDTVIDGNPDELFPNAPAVHTGVVNAANTIFKTPDSNHVYSNGVLVYDTEDLASSAYQSIIDQTKGEKLTVGQIGDETYAVYSTVNSDLILNTIHVAMILWRTGPVVSFLSSADSQNAPDPDTMPKLANMIQARLTGKAP
jgi:hypothetical protein